MLAVALVNMACLALESGPYSIEDDGDEDAADYCDWCDRPLLVKPIYIAGTAVCQECEEGGLSDVNGDEDDR